jgi:phosphoenolpyruvate carboxykinase (ATP)
MRIDVTRRLLTAALNGDLDDAAFHADPFLRVLVPEECPGVPAELLSPRETWTDPAAYDDHARTLAAQLAENFRQYAGSVPSSVASAGPSA